MIFPFISKCLYDITSEFHAIQQRLGEDGDLDYMSVHNQMRQRQEASSLSSMLQSFLQELPQVRQSKSKQ